MQTITIPSPNFIEEFEAPEGFTADLMVDTDAVNPRLDYDHFATLIQVNRGCISIDDEKHFGIGAAATYFGWDSEKLRRYVRMFFPDIIHFDTWDAYSQSIGSHGYGYVTADDLDRAGHRAHPQSRRAAQVAREIFESEVKEYAAWANGEVVGVIVTNDETGKDASLWGIYDDYPYSHITGEVIPELVAEVSA